MSPPTLLIRNARIIDGTGSPAFLGSVLVAGDRIVAVNRGDVASEPSAVEVIDAAGLVLAPGFIDAHTHYDAQLLWDKLVTPVAEHGATTVVTGSCSFTLAPSTPETREVIKGLFLKAEDLSLDNYASEVDFKWESFSEYLERIRPGLGVNVAPLIGHTPLRHYVMGPAAQERAATDAELDRMCDLLRGAVRAGAVGLSLSHLDTDENSVPIGSRWADTRERIALAKVLVEEGRGVFQSNLNFAPDADPCAELEAFGRISLETGVHVEALGCFAASPNDPVALRLLEKTVELHARGADVVLQTTSKPFDQFLQLDSNFFVFFLLPYWQDVMMGSVPERIAYLSDRTKRGNLLAALDANGHTERFKKAEVLEGFSAATKALEGRLVTDIAKERGLDFLDVLLDIALVDDLKTRFALRGFAHTDPDTVGSILGHPHTRPASGSDGGAHVYQFSTSGDSTWFLQHWVRECRVMSLERAIQRLTSIPARDFNVKDRGVIEIGKFADLVLFDPDRIAQGPTVRKFDLPDGSGRYLNSAIGISKVIVNGVVLVDEGKYTDARVGRLV